MRQVELDTPRVDTHAPAGSVVLWHTKLMHAAVRRPCVVGGAVQCSVVQCSAVQCSAVQCSAVQRSALHCTALQWRAEYCHLHRLDLLAVCSIERIYLNDRTLRYTLSYRGTTTRPTECELATSTAGRKHLIRSRPRRW
jgi:hypothetical protein